MKVLLLLTSYRQLEEVKLWAHFLSTDKLNIARTWDIMVMMNNIYSDITKLGEYFKNIPNENKTLIFTSKNKGYTFGQAAFWAEYFNYFKKYDFVIHHSIDVFMMDDSVISNILEYFFISNREEAFIVNKVFGIEKIADKTVGTDLFIFRPQLIKDNIFNDFPLYYDIYNHDTGGTEEILFDIIKRRNIPHMFIKRYDNNYWNPRRIDLWKCWHEHDLRRIKDYINSNENNRINR
jgi:hypothetical protein